MLDLAEYKLIVDSSPNMIWRAGLDGACNYFNQTWLAFTGRRMEQETGTGWAEGVHPDDLDPCITYYMDHFRRQVPFEMNYRLKRHDGRYRWINDRGVPVFSADGVFCGFIGSCMDITEKVEGQAVRRMAELDAVCGILNRPYSYQLLDGLLHSGTYRLSLIMLDIDDFKLINDRHGHLCGDDALRHTAAVLQGTLRAGDVLGRFGGDEFIIGLPETGIEGGVEAAERFREALAAQPLILSDGAALVLTISAGVDIYHPGEKLDELVSRADMALYRAKGSGKNRVCTLEK